VGVSRYHSFYFKSAWLALFLHQRTGAFLFSSFDLVNFCFMLNGNYFLLLFINRGLWRSGALVFLGSAIHQFTFMALSGLGVFN